MGRDGLDRREFLRRGVAAGVGLGLLPLGASALAAETPGVRRRVTLGRTGLEIPDIGFGASRLSGDEKLVRHAFDRGITYFDTAEGYTFGQSEETLGRALKGLRDRVLIASKVKCGADTGREALMEELEASLRRLRTDHVDVYFNHAVNDVRRLQNPEWQEFTSRAKEQGKIRFTGMSGHGGNLAECVAYALDHDLFDAMLLAHNFGQDPSFTQRFTRSMDFVAVQSELPPLLKRAREKGVGVVAMKTLRGARLNDMRPYEREGGTFAQAAFRWVLTGGYVDALVVTMKSPAQVDEYLAASGSRPDETDAALLDHYEERFGASQCRWGCGQCESACPAGVPIAEALRTRMYAEDYGDVALAREDYAKLGAGASACAACSHQSCTAACPHGLPVGAMLRPLHEELGGRT